ncbi:MAG: UpxY family transcription antiterminator [Chitinophagaceae bacterium]|nr:UpxY family transcription antiterminator [Chitinophagaceae bacterium]
MFEETANKKKWYALYTKPRWEKKVHAMLEAKDITSYCPLNKVSKKWSDRMKVVEEPLFKSYVFVQLAENEKTEVRMTEGVLNFVYWLGKPAIVKDDEILTIKLFLNEYQDVEALPLEIKPFDTVQVQRGILMGHKGKVNRVLHNRIEVVIESLGYKLVAYLDKSNIAPAGR